MRISRKRAEGLEDNKMSHANRLRPCAARMPRGLLAAALACGAACAMVPAGGARAAIPVTVDADPIAVVQSALQIAQSIKNTIQEVTSIFTLDTDLVDALRLHSGQQTANSKAEITALGNIADTQDQRQVQLRIEDAKLRALNSAASGASTCNVVTGNIGGQNIEQAVAIWREQIVQAQLDFDAGGPNSPARAGARAGIEGQLSAHCKNNATQIDVDQGICTGVTQQPTSMGRIAGLPAPNVGADLSANTILGAPNQVMSREDTIAGAQFLGTAIVGEPLGKLSKIDAQSEEGRRRIESRNIAFARQSVAMSVAGSVMANRQPFGSGQQVVGANGAQNTVQDWAEGTSKETLGYNPGGGNFPNGVSKNAWLELRSRGWFMNPIWAVKVDSQNADQTAKDLAMMTSFMVYQNNELYHQAENTNLLLAQIVSILNDGRRGGL